jgi:hypothetical protein
MATAKVIAGVKGTFFDALRKANSHVALRCCFKLPDKIEPISFFVPSHASNFTPYNPQNPDVQLITLEFTQRPADDLILMLGTLLEANCNSQQRKDERIVLSAANMKALGIDSRDAAVTIDGATHKCIIRDLSFGGTKLLVVGETELRPKTPVSVRMFKGEHKEEVNIAGAIVRVEEVEGRKDIHAIGIAYAEAPPMSYKLLINQYLTSARRNCPDPDSWRGASKAQKA